MARRKGRINGKKEGKELWQFNREGVMSIRQGSSYGKEKAKD